MLPFGMSEEWALAQAEAKAGNWERARELIGKMQGSDFLAAEDFWSLAEAEWREGDPTKLRALASALYVLRPASTRAGADPARLNATNSTMPTWAILAGENAWKLAEIEWRAGNPAKLNSLLRSHLDVPLEARSFIAAALGGAIKPDARRRRSGATKAAALELLSLVRTERDAMLADTDRIEASAERWGCETQDVRQWIHDSFNQAVESIAVRYGISPSTLKNWASNQPS